jgi:hypothetical protein
MRLIAFLLTAAVVSAVAADERAEPVRQAPRVLKPADAGVGRLVPDVAFTDVTGKAGKLSDFKGHELLVVAPTNASCPVGKKYAPTLARLEKEYSARGVGFLFVNPTATDKPDAAAFAGRYVHDVGHELTAALGARTTTEVFVLDAARTVVYRGAIDDQFGLGYSLDAPRNNYLAAALDDALAGRVPVVAATTAPGCELVLDSLMPRTPLTYRARIERIVQNNCVECHRAGGVAPFELTTYEHVAAHKGMIRKVVERGTMPPWFAAPPARGEHSPWANDRSLGESDKADLLAWLSGDLKKGDPADAPLPRTYADGWLIGTPDAVLQIPKPIAVKAQGTMAYQHVSVETDFDEDRWVKALEVRPTAREVVHHVLVFAVPRGMPRAVGEAQGFFAAYVPGNSTLLYPEGYAKKLPKGWTLWFQIHYTPNGTATTDQTRLGLVFAKEKPHHEVRVIGIANRGFTIPPGADNHKVEARIPVPFDARAIAFMPHAHLRGKAARYDAKFPDGTTKPLLEVPHYDFNWQLVYRPAEPVRVPRGGSIVYTAWYDNSDKNPANPDSTKPVRWGRQTEDEMHIGYLEYVIDAPAR